jgi:hypothetical protein
MSNNFPFELGSFARKSDPDTSKSAITPKRKRAWNVHATMLLVAYGNGRPMTAEEAIDAAGLNGAKSPWTRISGLIRKGMLCDTGERRASSCGAAQRVNAITPVGQAALSGLTH